MQTRDGLGSLHNTLHSNLHYIKKSLSGTLQYTPFKVKSSSSEFQSCGELSGVNLYLVQTNYDFKSIPIYI